MRKLVEKISGDVDGKARFAGASGPRQREQPGGLEEVLDFRHLPFTTYKARHLRGQIVRQDFERAQGRKVVRQIMDHELENTFGLAEILQPPLTEVAK